MAAVPLPLAQAGLSALNHVLRQQAWARDRLRAHAGRTVRMVVDSPLGRMSADARIATDGTLEATAAEAPSVTLALTPSVNAIFDALRGGPRALGGHLKVEGEVMVAAAVGEIAQHLRWEIEEDLSRVMGDALAHRAGEAARDLSTRSAQVSERLSSGLRQFLVDEGRQLIERAELRGLATSLQDLDARLSRLEASTRPLRG
jgi:ubiquinone biosynthesis protein UbiJ